MSYDLDEKQHAELLGQQLESLRTERARALLDVKRWSAIPSDLQDGSEQPAIDQAKKAVRVIEAQIDALEAPNG